MESAAGTGRKQIAIVGGGLGGLVAAFFLEGTRTVDGREVSCTLFERSDRIGGNMWTAYLGKAYERPIADLAVNDFNANTYTDLMRIIGVLDASGLPVPHGALIDSDCFFTARGAPGVPVSFTSEELADPARHPEKKYLEELSAEWARFEGLAAAVMTDPKYAKMSVAEFVRLERFSPTFRDWMLLPRINAMYFMPDSDPGSLPIRGVMYYYHLQEGLGTPDPTPDRRFFELGASQWARQLELFIRQRGTTVLTSVESIEIRMADGHPRVAWTKEGERQARAFDDVVCAVQPEDASALVVHLDLPPEFHAGLRAFGRYPGTAVVHRDPSVMPPQREQWRTYNVLIEERGAKQPYTMSYVNAMHNGVDAHEPPFVTENPFNKIAPGDVYDMVDLGHPAGGRIPAIALFHHNTLSVATMQFQAELYRYQGRSHVYYTGGWTNGAGLQEQIIAQSMNVAGLIRGHLMEGHEAGYRADRPELVPRYLRRTLGLLEAGAPPAPDLWPEPTPHEGRAGRPDRP